MSNSEHDRIPLPAKFISPWLHNNSQFLEEIKTRSFRITNIEALRAKYQDKIKSAVAVARCTLGAVDASSSHITLGDQISILVQAVRIEDDGKTTIGMPWRITEMDGPESRLAEMPMRMAAECQELAAVSTPTIADSSYWSLLMEINQAINRAESKVSKILNSAVNILIDDGVFLRVIENPFIVPMTKSNQTDKIFPGISDRQSLGQLLQANEYIIMPSEPLQFGIENRRFKSYEREKLSERYKDGISVIFYKPHDWTRAYRIESHTENIKNDRWLMPLLAAIKHHTATNRMIIEPFPQFMADYTARNLSAVRSLYGPLNWFRHPAANYIKTRTR